MKKGELQGLKNIGPGIAQRLYEVGIHKRGDLARVGPVKAFRMIREKHPDKHIPVCYYLYSLQGALMELHWNGTAKNTTSP